MITASMNAILNLFVEDEAPAAPLTEDVYEATASELPLPIPLLILLSNSARMSPAPHERRRVFALRNL